MSKYFLAGITVSTVVLVSSPVFAAATWMPPFEKGKAVYVDPSLSGHPVAPYRFSPQLEEQLKKQSKQGLQYFVIAAQQGNEAIPPGASLGPASADKLLSKWASEPAFAKGNYAVIFWVRKTEDLNKGSVGVNVSKVGRDNGVTTDLLSDPNGLVIPALKANMPANPEGAMQDIVSNIETQISDYKIAQQKEQERAAQRQADKKERREFVVAAGQFSLALVMWGTPLGALALGLSVFLRGRKKNKAEAEAAISVWESLCKNSSAVYYTIEMDELPKLKTLPLQQDAQLRADFDAFVSKLAEFISWSTTANELLEKAKTLAKQGKYVGAVMALSSKSVTIENSSIPITLASLKTGLDVEEEIPAQKLKARLENKWEGIRSHLADLLEYHEMYSAMADKTYFQDCADRYDDEHRQIVEELNTYRLDDGGTFFTPFEARTALDVYKTKILEAERSARAGKIREAIQAKEQATASYEKAASQMAVMQRNKSVSEQIEAVLSKANELSQRIREAQDAITAIQTEFPGESIDDLTQVVREASDFFEMKMGQYKDELASHYQQRRFEEAITVLRKVESEFGKAEEEISYVIASPGRFRSQKAELEQKLSELNRKNGTLKSRYRVETQENNWDLLNLAILQAQVSSFESSVSDASRQQRRDESYASSSSSSSSSDYGSYSSGSDYGGSSGGGGYGGSSGGGDY